MACLTPLFELELLVSVAGESDNDLRNRHVHLAVPTDEAELGDSNELDAALSHRLAILFPAEACLGLGCCTVHFVMQPKLNGV